MACCSLFSGYILEVDTEKRPDIYQVSYAAFQIAGRESPVQNLNVSVGPFALTLMFSCRRNSNV